MVFGRKRAASNPHNHPRYGTINQNPSPSSSAAAAAAQAFNKDNGPDGNLSAAAAAAALRSHTTSPVPVGQLQTKRILQRRGSNNSVASARPGGLERRGSSSSMTERTFRSPSPGGRNAGDGLYGRHPKNVPPVPPLPAQASRTHRRAASLEPSTRITTPASKSHGRGQSLDRGSTAAAPTSAPSTPSTAASVAAVKASPGGSTAKGKLKLARIQELEKENSNRSVNFSRPMSPSLSNSPVSATASPGIGSSPSLPLTSAAARPQSTSNESTGLGIQEDTPKRKKKKKVVKEDVVAAGVPASSPIDANAVAARVFSAPIVADSTAEVASKEIISPNQGRKLEPAATSTLANGAVKAARAQRAMSVDEASLVKTTGAGSVSRVKSMSRETSLSPSRKAHFSNRPTHLDQGVKHDPRRAASPVKSALKHSPSNSVLSVRPESPSPADELVAVKKKKAARVSFDEPERPVLDATKHVPAADITAQPESKKVDDFSYDEALKPTPTLPSFGSIRGTPRQDRNESLETSVATLVGEEPSNDHAAGSVLAQDNAPREAAIQESNKLPTTAADGTAVSSPLTHSDSDSDDAQERTLQSSKHAVGDIESKQPSENTVEDSNVPNITLQPATPANEEKEPKLELPGAFPRASGEVDKNALAEKIAEEEATKDASAQHHAITTETPIAAPVVISSPQNTVDEETETESEVDSVYSDAAEDFEDADDGGYASLNAIVEATVEEQPETPPVIKRSTFLDATTPATGADAKNPSAKEWDAATEYWRSLSAQRRKELEAQMRGEKGAASEEDEEVVQPVTPVPKPRKKKKKVIPEGMTDATMVAATGAAIVAANPPAAPRQTKDEKPTLRKTLRGGPVQPVSLPSDSEDSHMMPSTLRGPKPAKKKSARQPATPVASGLSASKYAPKEPASSLQQKTLRSRPSSAAAAATAAPNGGTQPVVKPTLQRSSSAGSDSSFKRSRGRRSSVSSDTGGRFTLRRSMRSPQPTAQPPPSAPSSGLRSSRFSVRSISPTGSENRYSMRASTLRGNSMDSGRPASLRSLQLRDGGGKAKKSLFGFGKSKSSRGSRSGSVAGSAVGSVSDLGSIRDLGSPPPPVNRRSRYAGNSDDESLASPAVERERPAFRSRFADSSDEEGDFDRPTPAVKVARPVGSRTTSANQTAPAMDDLRPVRGIPRRPGQEDDDSTDLEDESDTEGQRKRKEISASRDETESRKQPFERMSVPPVPSSKDVDAGMQSRVGSINRHKNEGGMLSAGTMRGANKTSLADRPRRGVESSDEEDDIKGAGGKGFLKKGFGGLSTSKHAPPAVGANRPSTAPVSGPPVTSPTSPTTTSAAAVPPTSPAQRPQQRRRLSGILGFGSPKKNKNKRSESLPPTSSIVSATPQEPSTPIKNPKLQRRSTPQTVPTIQSNTAGTAEKTTDPSWPLSIPKPAFARGASSNSATATGSDDKDRPSTSDGITLRTSMRRPNTGQRRSTAEPQGLSSSKYAPPQSSTTATERRHVGFDEGTVGGDDDDLGLGGSKTGRSTDGEKEEKAVYGRSGKKKRFLGLRKVFGLKD